MRKIVIIGNAGSGKTTLACALHKKLNLPLYHLDQYYWLPNWQRKSLEEFTQIHDKLCKQDAWIIEGSYYRLLPQRIEQAEVIIFLDIPSSVCLRNVLKRSLFNWGVVIPGNPAGCEQRIFTRRFVEFLRWVWNFNKRYRAMLLGVLAEAQRTKQVYIFTSHQEANQFIEQLKT